MTTSERAQTSVNQIRARTTLLGELLIKKGKLTDENLQRALKFKKEQGCRLGQALVTLGLVTELDIADALKQQGRVACITLYPEIIDPNVAGEIGEVRSRQWNLVAVNRIAGMTTVAMEDPGDVYRIDELSRIFNTPIMPVRAEPSAITKSLEVVFGKKEEPPPENAADIEDIIASAGEDFAVNLDIGTSNPDAEGENDANLDKPIINLIRRVFEDGYRARASDIHFEARQKAFVVRFRVDGCLYDRLSLPRGWARPCLARLKVLAELDLAQRRLPQDGRAQAEIDGRRVDLRVATTPTIGGESAVIRILDGGRELRDIESLDLDPLQMQRLIGMTECSDGFVMTTGPTGSGKTTTLYGLLKRLNKPDTKIITLEDPVENQLDGVTQINAAPKVGLTFAKGLRSILRQDPDVVLIGEIRDEETAQIAVEAALTGHLVLSTLHTVGTAETITRLTEMGVESYLLADTIRGIVSQRLIRRICKACKQLLDTPPEVLSRLGIDPSGDVMFFHGAGCEECHGTGYKGRVGLYEVMVMTPAIASLITRGKPTEDIQAEARASGMTTLMDDGIRKARAGHTSLAEVLSVTGRQQKQT